MQTDEQFQPKPEKNHFIRNFILTFFILILLCICWVLWVMLSPVAQQESTEKLARRNSADNAFPLLVLAANAFPPKPTKKATQEINGKEATYEPARNTMGWRLKLNLPDDDPDLLKYLAECEPVVVKAREALKKDYCLVTPDVMHEQLLSEFLNNGTFFKIMDIARLLGARAIEAFYVKKDIGAAEEYVKDLLRLSSLLQDDGLSMFGEVIAAGTSEYLLNIITELPDDQLKSSIQYYHSIQKSLTIAPDDFNFCLLFIDSLGKTEKKPSYKTMMTLFRMGLHFMGYLSSVNQTEATKLITLPYPEFSAKMKSYDEGTIQKRLPFSWNLVVSGLKTATTCKLTIYNGMELISALELYRRSNNQFPAKLSDLEPILGAPIPLDPFSENPYIYIHDDEKCTIYGVGPDGIDDKGNENNDNVFTYSILPHDDKNKDN